MGMMMLEVMTDATVSRLKEKTKKDTAYPGAVPLLRFQLMNSRGSNNQLLVQIDIRMIGK